MKSLEYVKEHIDEFEEDNLLDRRFTKRLIDFIPVDEWGKFGFKYTGEGEPTKPKEWTEQNVIAQLRKDIEFGIKKAVNHRGISAELMQMVVIAWCKVLENGLENSEYGYYGSETFKAVDEYYGFGLVKEDTFDEDFYGDWS